MFSLLPCGVRFMDKFVKLIGLVFLICSGWFIWGRLVFGDIVSDEMFVLLLFAVVSVALHFDLRAFIGQLDKRIASLEGIWGSGNFIARKSPLDAQKAGISQ